VNDRRPIFVLKLRPETACRSYCRNRAVRQMLKALLRTHGLRCVQIYQEEENDRESTITEDQNR
jgi:hypothetical protein